MKILVIRHGESLADILHVHEGRADFELTSTGIKQAEAMSEYIKNTYSLSLIYSSTLKRVAKTAKILRKATSANIVFDKDLMEFNNRKLAGLSRDVPKILDPQSKRNILLEILVSMYGE